MIILLCLECFSPLDKERAESVGMVECPTCSTKQAVEDESLTLVDDLPVDEYLGG